MPAWFRRLRARLRYGRFDRDLREELDAHRAQMQHEWEAAGVAPDDAARRARRDFGNATLAREQARGVWIAPALEGLWQDVRYAARVLRRNPVFALTAACVLSLGIGVNTALFSVLNGIFNRPLHVERPEELFYLTSKNSAGQVIGAFDPVATRFFTAQAAGLATFTEHWIFPSQAVSVRDETDRTGVEVVTANYFDVLGVPMTVGRPFRPQDDELSNVERAIVVSHAFWMRRLGGAPTVLGTEVRVQDRFFRIIGVAAEGFRGLSDPWHPIEVWVTSAQLSDNRFGLGPVGRVKPGVTIGQIQALVAERTLPFREDLYSRFTPEARLRSPDWVHEASYPVLRVLDVSDPNRPDTQLIPTNVLVAMVSVVILVLVIASTNVAGLLLARGVTRTGEVAVRRALGAGRARLVRQLLTESILLGLCGGVIGAGLSLGFVAVFRRYTPPAFAVDVFVDWRVLAFAVAVAVGSGVLVGLTPALQAIKIDVIQALGAGVVGARHLGGRLNRWVVVPQVALSLVLLLLAAVHLRALTTIESNDLGYHPEGVMVFGVGRWEQRRITNPFGSDAEKEAEKVRVFNRGVLDAMSELPGAPPFALATRLPLSSGTSDTSVLVDRDTYLHGVPVKTPAKRIGVSDGYFAALDMRLLKGRTFDGRDVLYGTRVAVISEHTAQSLWPGQDPLGRQVAFSSEGDGKIEWLSVIGVVNEADPVVGAAADRPTVYVSLLQEWRGDAPNLIVRSHGDQATLIRDVKRAVTGADSFAEVTSVRTMPQMIDDLLYPRRAAAAILAVAGFIGLLLASIGLYGVVSHAAAQRMRELGVRAALGATPRDLVMMLVRDGATVSTGGVVAGALLAAIALRLTAKIYPDLPALDGLSFAVVPAVLLLIVLAACFLPAHRAGRVDPARVLRGE